MTKNINDVKSLKYTQGDYIFYFSTRNNLELYSKTIFKYIITNKKFLQDKYYIDYINAEKLLYVAHYRDIEKRIFRVDIKTTGSNKVTHTLNKKYCVNLIIPKSSKKEVEK